MSSSAKAVPETQPGVTAYLCFKDAARAIEFYKKAFGATERGRLADASGRIGHAEITIGGSTIMLADEFPDYGALSAETLGGSPVKMHLYVDDVDAVARQAVAVGAKVVRPVQDQFYGDRSGHLADPFGYVWIIATRKEVVSMKEMQARWDAMSRQEGGEHPRAENAPKPVKFVREGFHTVTPYLIVAGAGQLIDFLKGAFAAEERFRVQPSEGGAIMHAEVKIGDSIIEMADANPQYPPMPATLHLYLPDVDAAYERALGAGASSLQAPADQPYGDRSAGVTDAFGNRWFIATHVKDVAP